MLSLTTESFLVCFIVLRFMALNLEGLSLGNEEVEGMVFNKGEVRHNKQSGSVPHRAVPD